MEHINVKHLVVEQFVGSITRVHWIVGDMVGSSRCSQYSPSAIQLPSHRLWRIDQTTCYRIGLLVGCILFMHVHTISALNANTLVGNQLMHFTFPNSVCQIFVLLLFGYVLFIISCRLLFLCILNACLQVNNQPLLFYIVVKRRE